MLEGYSPEKFFYWFERITQIPRPSFHEEKICDFVEAFAVSHNLAYYRDKTHNILLRVPATSGYENEPPLLLQSHMDMVALLDKVHQAVFGCLPGHQYIHGGIEVGVIAGAIPQMDAVGMLPSMANAHTPKEVLYIDQVPDYWKLITAVLAEKVSATY